MVVRPESKGTKMKSEKFKHCIRQRFRRFIPRGLSITKNLSQFIVRSQKLLYYISLLHKNLIQSSSKLNGS